MLAQDSFTARIDRIVLHRYFGFPIFFAILGGLFASIFWAAQPFMDFIEWGFGEAGQLTLQVLPEGMLSKFIAEGIIRRRWLGRGIFPADSHSLFPDDAARRFGLSLARRGAC